MARDPETGRTGLGPADAAANRGRRRRCLEGAAGNGRRDRRFRCPLPAVRGHDAGQAGTLHNHQLPGEELRSVHSCRVPEAAAHGRPEARERTAGSASAERQPSASTKPEIVNGIPHDWGPRERPFPSRRTGCRRLPYQAGCPLTSAAVLRCAGAWSTFNHRRGRRAPRAPAGCLSPVPGTPLMWAPPSTSSSRRSPGSRRSTSRA